MRKRRPHAYRVHSGRNLGYVRGAAHSAESTAAYEEYLEKWRAEADRTEYPATVADLVVAYTDWAEERFVKHGEPTRYAANIKAQLKLLLKVHRHTLVVEFTPILLSEWLDSLNGTLDRRCKQKRRLPKGHTKAPDARPVRPANDNDVDAAMPFMRPRPARKHADHRHG